MQSWGLGTRVWGSRLSFLSHMFAIAQGSGPRLQSVGKEEDIERSTLCTKQEEKSPK